VRIVVLFKNIESNLVSGKKEAAVSVR